MGWKAVMDFEKEEIKLEMWVWLEVASRIEGEERRRERRRECGKDEGDGFWGRREGIFFSFYFLFFYF